MARVVVTTRMPRSIKDLANQIRWSTAYHDSLAGAPTTSPGRYLSVSAGEYFSGAGSNYLAWGKEKFESDSCLQVCLSGGHPRMQDQCRQTSSTKCSLMLAADRFASALISHLPIDNLKINCQPGQEAGGRVAFQRHRRSRPGILPARPQASCSNIAVSQSFIMTKCPLRCQVTECSMLLRFLFASAYAPAAVQCVLCHGVVII